MPVKNGTLDPGGGAHLTSRFDRRLSRRDLLRLLGSTGGVLLLGACQTQTPDVATPGPPSGPVAPTVSPAASPAPSAGTPTVTATGLPVPTCVVVPAQAEGPYFVDLKLNRNDIRSDPSDGSVRPGTPLALTFRVSQVSGNGCAPLAGALLDIWHCDADGVYSGVLDGRSNAQGKQFLRGYQVTDAQGKASFLSIYPGWYAGRAVHIHFKVRTNPSGARGAEFTSQLYFDEALTDQVYARQPYAARSQARTRNSADSLYRAGGPQLTLLAVPQDQGFAAVFDIGLRV